MLIKLEHVCSSSRWSWMGGARHAALPATALWEGPCLYSRDASQRQTIPRFKNTSCKSTFCCVQIEESNTNLHSLEGYNKSIHLLAEPENDPCGHGAFQGHHFRASVYILLNISN